MGFEGEVLRLAHNFVSHHAFSAFTQSLKRFPNLKCVDLRGNQLNDSEALVSAFQEAEESKVVFKLRSNKGVNKQVLKDIAQEGYSVEKGSKIQEKSLLSL